VRVATIAVNGPFMAKTKDRYHDSLETNVIVTDTSVTVAPVSFATILAIRRFDSRFFGVEKTLLPQRWSADRGATHNQTDLQGECALL